MTLEEASKILSNMRDTYAITWEEKQREALNLGAKALLWQADKRPYICISSVSDDNKELIEKFMAEFKSNNIILETSTINPYDPVTSDTTTKYIPYETDVCPCG